MPGSSSTKAPKSMRRVTVPVTALADFVLVTDFGPGLGFKLLETEREAFGLGLDLEDLEAQLLADGEDVLGSVDAGPGDVADVEETVDAAEINERSEARETAHGAFDDVAFLELGIAALAFGFRQRFGDRAAIDDDVFFFDVELEDEAGDLLADELFHLGSIFNAAARCGHEGADANVYAEAALDDCGDDTGDRRFRGEGLFEATTSPWAARCGCGRVRSSARHCGP